MNIAFLAGLTVDLPGADARGSLDTAQRRHHSWQRAMEQAQLSGWFKPQGDGGQAQDQDAIAAAQATAATPGSRLAPSSAAAGTAAQPTTMRSAHSIATAHAMRTVDDGAAAQPGNAPSERYNAAQFNADSDTAGLRQAGRADAAITRGLVREVQRLLRQVMPQPLGVGTATSPGQDATLVPAVSTALRVAQPTSAAAIGLQLPAMSAMSVMPAAPMEAGLAPIQSGNAVSPVAPDVLVEDTDATVEAAGSGAEAVARVGGRAAGADDAPVRIHIDWSQEGAHVWLGVDQQRLPSVTAMARQLEHWLRDGGVKLATLVCNGRTIYTRFSPRRTQ